MYECEVSQYLRAEAHEVVVLQFVAAARRPPLAAAPLVCGGATSRAVFGREEIEVAPHVGAVALQRELTLAGPALQTDMQTYIMTVRASRIMVWARVKYIMVQVKPARWFPRRRTRVSQMLIGARVKY